MASPTERIRAFRGDRRSKVAIRSILRGDSIWLRSLIFVIMSAIFFLLVTLTKRTGLQTQTGSTPDSTEAAQHEHLPSPPANTTPPSRSVAPHPAATPKSGK